MKRLSLFLMIFLTISFTATYASNPENGKEAKEDIVGLAASTDMLSTLVTAVKQAGLVETLQAKGPYTVFAPTNAAFEALPEGVLEALLKPENKDKLVKVLTYHVVMGELSSGELVDGLIATTAEGSNVKVNTGQGMVRINEAEVVQADIEATNGIVHLIDKVILPPDFEL
ncbi:MAG: fasciclin domain-containing protein [Cyclobacteriaceae bacterium]